MTRFVKGDLGGRRLPVLVGAVLPPWFVRARPGGVRYGMHRSWVITR